MQVIYCSFIYIRQKLNTNLIPIYRRVTEFILYTRTMKYDAGMQANKLGLYQIPKEFSMRKCFAKTMTKNRFHMHAQICIYMSL